MSNSKTDNLACALRALAAQIETLDTRFGDEQGNVKINTIEDGIEVVTMAYSLIKEVYACYGKVFQVNIPGVGGKVLELILELLNALADQKGGKTI